MSIDLDVIPTTARVICWRNIVGPLREILGTFAVEYLGETPSLINQKTRTVMDADCPLALTLNYSFQLAVRNTLDIIVMPNEGNVYEVDYLEDYGRNLDADTIQRLARQWRDVGHHYGLETYAGRSEQEPRILVALASAVASACNGYVILVDNDIFDLNVGVYTPEQFRIAKPLFR